MSALISQSARYCREVAKRLQKEKWQIMKWLQGNRLENSCGRQADDFCFAKKGRCAAAVVVLVNSR